MTNYLAKNGTRVKVAEERIEVTATDPVISGEYEMCRYVSRKDHDVARAGRNHITPQQRIDLLRQVLWGNGNRESNVYARLFALKEIDTDGGILMLLRRVPIKNNLVPDFRELEIASVESI